MAKFFITRIKEGPTARQIQEAEGHPERKVVFYTTEDLALAVEVLEVDESLAVSDMIHIRARENKKVLGTEELTIRYDTRRLRGNVSPFIPWHEGQA